MATPRGALRQYWVAIRVMLVATLVLGVVYPVAITGIGAFVAPDRANGSLLRGEDGEVVGSALLGQSFTDEDGAALPEWFQSRPSAAGDGYDGASSGGSNQGPESADLIDAITARQQAIGDLDGVATGDIPADAVTASASGLDPHISPDYALLQVPRVAEERGLDAADVEDLVRSMISPGDLGYLGDPTVNVLRLNLALQRMG